MSEIEDRSRAATEEGPVGVNRRSFLSRLGAVGAAVTASPLLGQAHPPPAENPEGGLGASWSGLGQSECQWQGAPHQDRRSSNVVGLSS